MEPNPAYHYGQRSKQLDDYLYEEVDTRTTKCSSITHEEVQDPVREKTNSKLAGKKTKRSQRCLSYSYSCCTSSSCDSYHCISSTDKQLQPGDPVPSTGDREFERDVEPDRRQSCFTENR